MWIYVYSCIWIVGYKFRNVIKGGANAFNFCFYLNYNFLVLCNSDVMGDYKDGLHHAKVQGCHKYHINHSPHHSCFFDPKPKNYKLAISDIQVDKPQGNQH